MRKAVLLIALLAMIPTLAGCASASGDSSGPSAYHECSNNIGGFMVLPLCMAITLMD